MDPIRVTVQVPFGGTHPFSVAADSTVRTLWDRVSAAVPSASRAAQCLVFQGRVLPDDRSLRDAHVRDGAVLHVMRRPATGREQAERQAASDRASAGADDVEVTFAMYVGQMFNMAHPHESQHAGPVRAPREQARSAREARRARPQEDVPPEMRGAQEEGERREGQDPLPLHEEDDRQLEQEGFLIVDFEHDFMHEHHHDYEDEDDHHHHHHFHSHHGHDHDYDHDHDRDHDHEHDHHHEHEHDYHHEHEHDHGYSHGHHHHDGNETLDHEHEFDHAQFPESVIFTQEAHMHHMGGDHGDNQFDSDSEGSHMHQFATQYPSHLRNPQDGDRVHYFNFGNPTDAPEPREPPNQTDVFLFHHNSNSQARYVDIYDVVAYVLDSFGMNDAVVSRSAATAAGIAAAAQLPFDRSHAMRTVLENAWFESRRASARIMPPTELDRDQSSDSSEIPSRPNEQTTATAAAEILLPSLADMLRAVANRIDSTQVPTLVEGTGHQQAEELVNQFASLSATLASTGALISTLAPSNNSEQAPQSSAERQTGSGGQEDVMADHDRNGEDTNNTSNSEQPPTRTNGRNGENRRASQVPRASSSNGASHGPENARNGALRVPTPEPSGRTAQAGNRGTASGGDDRQARNGDFVLRLISYYLRSISPGLGGRVDLPVVEGDTADSVLDSVYGSGSRADPADWWLRVTQRVMQGLTPQQFHAVLSGDFSPLNSLELEIMTVIAENLVGGDLDIVDDEMMMDAFSDAVCEAMHTFSHEIEDVHNLRAGLTGRDRLSSICSHTMPVIVRNVELLAGRLSVQRDAPAFGDELLCLLKLTWGEFSNALGRILNVGWADLLAVLRQALRAAGGEVVGEPMAVLFPLCLNLFSRHAKLVYDEFRNNQENSNRIYQRGPTTARERPAQSTSGRVGVAMTQRSPSENAVSHADDDDIDDLPELLEETPPEPEDGAPEEDNNQETNTLYVNNPARHVSNSDVELGSGDFSELAAELDEEYKAASDMNLQPDINSIPSSEDMDTVARELEQEHTSTRASPAPSADKPTRIPTSGVKRMAGMSSALASSMNRPGYTTGLGIATGTGATSNHRTTFSNARSVPRTSQSAVPLKPRDEFEKVLGRQNGAIWRQAVRGDEAKMHSSTRGPLSRGYNNDTSPVPPLTPETAAVMAVEDARAAAREAQLSGEATEELVNAVKENRSLYLQELQNAITSRIAIDPDFDRQRFPNAAKRFAKPG